MDRIAVRYPLPGNADGGRIYIYGLEKHTKKVEDISTSRTIARNENEETNNATTSVAVVTQQQQQQQPAKVKVLFFCGGFPDHWSSFESLAQRFCAGDSNIICGVTCLPGYDTIHPNNFKCGGYTFDEMAVSLQSACKVLLTAANDVYTKHDKRISIQLTGIFHDWGSYVGAMVVNRSNHETLNYFHSVVYFDVLPPAHPKSRIPRDKFNLYKSLVLMSYTSLFAMCHTLQRYLSYWLAAPVAMIGYSILFVIGLIPIQWIDNMTFFRDRPREYTLRKIIYMQYPYYELWCGILFQGPRKFIKTKMNDATLPENVTSSVNNGTPILYMYGTKKNAMFHDTNVLAWLQQQQQSSSRVVQVESAGHWLYRQQEDICYETISQFIGTVVK